MAINDLKNPHLPSTLSAISVVKMMALLTLRSPKFIFSPIQLHPNSSKMSSLNISLNTHSLKTSSSSNSSTVSLTSNEKNNNRNHKRKLPILLFDIMDTIVRDPFYQDVPTFFRMSMKELIESKHPTAWIEFEKGLIDEMELARKFFKDGRPLDLEGLKSCMTNGYYYIEGVEGLLCDLKQNNYEIHAFTNYPIWYQMIEDKLKVSTYLSWTFCSCITGKRKPERDFYLQALRHLDIEPSNCIFIDDRMKNVEAAIDVGIVGLHFKNADLLCQDLSLLGIEISTDEHKINQDPAELAQEHMP